MENIYPATASDFQKVSAQQLALVFAEQVVLLLDSHRLANAGQHAEAVLLPFQTYGYEEVDSVIATRQVHLVVLHGKARRQPRSPLRYIVKAYVKPEHADAYVTPSQDSGILLNNMLEGCEKIIQQRPPTDEPFAVRPAAVPKGLSSGLAQRRDVLISGNLSIYTASVDYLKVTF